MKASRCGFKKGNVYIGLTEDGRVFLGNSDTHEVYEVEKVKVVDLGGFDSKEIKIDSFKGEEKEYM